MLAIQHLTVIQIAVIRRASEVVLVTGGGKWGLQECSSFVNMSNHEFPRGATNVKMKCCVNCWCDILVQQDTPIVPSSCSSLS